jgi:transcriptional regulator with XRE-family HTH domain
MTQHQLAVAAGVSDGTIGLVESGRRNLGPGTLERVADALGLADGDREAMREAQRRKAGKQHGLDDDQTEVVDLTGLSEADKDAVRMIVERFRTRP